MKKIILSVFTLVTMSFMACGPSAEEIAAKEKAKQDSIANVEAEAARVAAETAAAAAAQKAMEDSLAAVNQKAMEDSLAALKGTVKKMQQKAATQKAKEEKKVEDIKKVTKGKG